jgi:DNA-binding response OmpR family regulator
MKILIIEDEKKLATLIKNYLEKHSYSADIANDGAEGLEKLDVNHYDLILLDINLPDMLGFEIVKEVRNSEENKNMGIIITSARDEVKDRSGGLNLGADDYLVKPFELVELDARINAVVRRLNHVSTPCLCINDLSIDPISREVKIKDQLVLLNNKEYATLKYIAYANPRYVSTEELIEHLYDEDFNPFSSVIRVHLSRLRKKLVEANEGEHVIENVKGIGYRLCQ